MLATRFSNSFCVELPQQNRSAVLVRIYPMQGIGQPIELDGDCVYIGRDDKNTIHIEDDSVSRRHAKIEWTGQQHVLVDAGSTNGSFVNEQRTTSQPLQAGDRIRFGNQIFKYLTSQGIESQYHEVVFKMMTTDGMTQLYNKRYFAECVEREQQQSLRSHTPWCVMLMDLDKFKSVNDTYGHMAGDAVLVEFANRAKSVLRSGQVLARYGGEEFAMLCSQATIEDARTVAERIREVVAATPVVFESQLIRMTVSIGIASFDHNHPVTIPQLLAQADEMLYHAKQSGRNQVQFARDC
jgi:diguanylate cyclase (GGDEF)-like protein